MHSLLHSGTPIVAVTEKEDFMTHSPTHHFVAIWASLVLVVGCGDSRAFSLDPGHIDHESLPAHGCFEGAEAELVRYSTRCDRPSAESLTSTIGEGTEFSAAAVGMLGSPCAGEPGPAVEVRFEHESVVFDFSEITSPGRFAKADFDGYLIDLRLGEQNALLLAAAVNRDRSTLVLESDAVYHEHDYIEVNFQDVAYDESGLVEIQLVFADVTPIDVVP